MKRTLVTPDDLELSEIESLLKRATSIAGGAAPQLAARRIALALAGNALPVDAAQVLSAAGAEVVIIPPQKSTADLAKQINASNPAAAIVSTGWDASAGELAGSLGCSFLNAGDGISENPARALVDAFTINSARGLDSTLRVALLGNLKYSAQAHSLARLLGRFDLRLSFVTPAALSMPYDLTDRVRLTAYEVEETNDLATTLRKTDVLYLSNIDAGRMDAKTYDKTKRFYNLTPETFAEAKPGLLTLGEWDGAGELLAPAQPMVSSSARAMLLALAEWLTT